MEFRKESRRIIDFLYPFDGWRPGRENEPVQGTDFLPNRVSMSGVVKRMLEAGKWVVFFCKKTSLSCFKASGIVRRKVWSFECSENCETVINPFTRCCLGFRVVFSRSSKLVRVSWSLLEKIGNVPIFVDLHERIELDWQIEKMSVDECLVHGWSRQLNSREAETKRRVGGRAKRMCFQRHGCFYETKNWIGIWASKLSQICYNLANI